MQVSTYWCFYDVYFPNLTYENSLIQIWWNFMWFFKYWTPPYRFMSIITKGTWLIYLLVNVMLRNWVTYSRNNWPFFYFIKIHYRYYQCNINPVNKNFLIFLANCIVLNLLKWFLLLFKPKVNRKPFLENECQQEKQYGQKISINGKSLFWKMSMKGKIRIIKNIQGRFRYP